jgi:hypothetical protein
MSALAAQGRAPSGWMTMPFLVRTLPPVEETVSTSKSPGPLNSLVTVKTSHGPAKSRSSMSSNSKKTTFFLVMAVTSPSARQKRAPGLSGAPNILLKHSSRLRLFYPTSACNSSKENIVYAGFYRQGHKFTPFVHVDAGNHINHVSCCKSIFSESRDFTQAF